MRPGPVPGAPLLGVQSDLRPSLRTDGRGRRSGVACALITLRHVKTFDDLWTELSAKVATADPASGTVRLVQSGVHEVGKKLVEEAAEAWMAAEHESAERAAEELSQLLYHVRR